MGKNLFGDLCRSLDCMDKEMHGLCRLFRRNGHDTCSCHQEPEVLCKPCGKPPCGKEIFCCCEKEHH